VTATHVVDASLMCRLTALGDAICVAFLSRFAARKGKQSGGKARQYGCDPRHTSRESAVSEIALGDATCVAFLSEFAAGEGKQSGDKARRRRSEICRCECDV